MRRPCTSRTSVPEVCAYEHLSFISILNDSFNRFERHALEAGLVRFHYQFGDGEMDRRSKENRLRREALRQGLRLYKSRARDFNDETFGGYMLAYSERNAVAYTATGRGYSLSLVEVEAYLERRKKRTQNGAPTSPSTSGRTLD